MLAFNKEHVSSFETFSSERIMVTCRSHPTFGDDVIFVNWPRDYEGNKVVIGDTYIDTGHALQLSVTVVEFAISDRGDAVVCLFDEDGAAYSTSSSDSLQRI